jgi:hypothetical protein
MRWVMFALIILSYPTFTWGLWNKKVYQESCKPAVDCVMDNVCYCSGLFDGWKNGGMAPASRTEGAFCYKSGRDCQCGDCGYWFAPGDQCQEWRCDDDVGVVENGKCYHVDPATGARVKKDGNVDREYSNEAQFNCYKTKVMCDPNICKFGEQLVGCKRASPGTCTTCPTALADGHFWKSKGKCDQTRCTAVGPGKFLAKACTTTTDAVIAGCASYPGNPQYAVPRQDGRATFYCPGGGLVLPLPENSQPALNYTAFVCNEGYYLNGASACLPCPPGSACRHGRKYACPMHYYSSAFSMTECRRCSAPTECGSKWLHPVRCAQGSTANPGCVSCGGCSYDPRQGISCVMEEYEMQGLPAVCRPTDAVGDVAVCQL